nr:rep protein [Cressdnaviricota sp.]
MDTATSTATRRQGTYWIGTISCDQPWEPALPTGVAYIRGQRELGAGGFEHWQIFFITSTKHSCVALARLWSPVVGHWELTRSSAAEQYVWKDDTRVGEPFEFGTRPIRRNSSTDWELIKQQAIEGELALIPADLFIRYYRTFQAIAADHSVPVAMERHCVCFWGKTGTGKSRSAWELGGQDSYAKDPRSKFWCGYRSQSVVIVDEFRG